MGFSRVTGHFPLWRTLYSTGAAWVVGRPLAGAQSRCVTETRDIVEKFLTDENYIRQRIKRISIRALPLALPHP